MKFKDLKRVFHKWLELKDENLIAAMTGAVVANLFKQEKIWLFVVGPPGSAKSIIIDSMSRAESIIHHVSSFTNKTLASGRGKQASSLFEWTDKVITISDFTTLLSVHTEVLGNIFGQLRQVYDGRYDAEFGTGQRIHWSGFVGMVMGCTPELDRKRAVFAGLGERCIIYRLLPDDWDAMTRVCDKAQGNTNRRERMKEELGDAMGSFLEGMKKRLGKPPTYSRASARTIRDCAIATAYGRAGTARDPRTQEVELEATRESPTRLVQIYTMYAQGLAAMKGKRQVGGEELEIIKKVSEDSMLRMRAKVLRFLYDRDDFLKTTDIGPAVRMPNSMIHRVLEDLWISECIDRQQNGHEESFTIKDARGKVRTINLESRRGRHPDYWRISPAIKNLLHRCGW